MHCLSSLEVGQMLPDLRPLSNDSKDLPDAESEHGIVRSLHWFIEKNSGEVWGKCAEILCSLHSGPGSLVPL